MTAPPPGRPKKGDGLKTSLLLSPEGRRRLEELSTELGVPKTKVLELALREMAKRSGVK